MEVRLDELQIGDQVIEYTLYWEIVDIIRVTDSEGEDRIKATIQEIRNSGPRLTDYIYGSPGSTTFILPRGKPTLFV